MRGDLKWYVPLAWDADSALSADEQRDVETNRKDLWRNGVRTEPNLTRMAFEFGACQAAMRSAPPNGPAKDGDHG